MYPPDAPSSQIPAFYTARLIHAGDSSGGTVWCMAAGNFRSYAADFG